MRFRRTTVFTLGFLAFLLGLGFARTGWLISYELVISLVILWLVTILRLRLLAVVATLGMAFAVGWLRGQMYMPHIETLQSLDGLKVVAVVTADSDLYYNKRAQLTFDAKQLLILEPEERLVPGRLTVSGFGESAIFKGDEIQISGRLYTTRGSKQLGMSFAELEKLESHPSAIQDLRREFGAGLATAVPEPAASLGLGLLIGQRSTLPEYVATALSAVGLTHIVAVSGYNLTIIMRGVKSLLSKRSKYQITMLSLLLIGVFLLMTGMSASIVRAALVSGLSILAWHYGRTFRPLLLLGMVAALTAAWNPFYLWSDIGWYLSFLAFFGVLVIAPAVQKRLFGDKQLKLVLVVCIESMSAMVMTLPLIMFIFERVSIVALLANILVVPLVPLAMLTSAIAGLAGMIAPVLAGLIAWPATTLLTAMIDIVMLLARIPFAQVSQGMNVLGMLLCYGAILFATHIVWRVNQKNAKITEMKVNNIL